MLEKYQLAINDSYVALHRDDGIVMQSVPVGDGLYCCSIGDSSVNYVCPHELTFEQLSAEFHRFDAFTDQVIVPRSWKKDHSHFSSISGIFKWIAVACVMDAVIVLLFTGLPEGINTKMASFLHACAHWIGG